MDLLGKLNSNTTFSLKKMFTLQCNTRKKKPQFHQFGNYSYHYSSNKYNNDLERVRKMCIQVLKKNEATVVILQQIFPLLYQK